MGYGDCVGIVGFLLYLGNYILITFQMFDSRSIRFFAVNICAAGCVLFSLSEDFNLAAAMIQIFWIGLGLVAIMLRVLPRWRYRTARGQGRNIRKTATLKKSGGF